MTGEISRAKQRKTVTKAKSAKSSENGVNGINGSNVSQNNKPSTGSSKTSLFIRLIFYTLLSVFVVVATLVSLDYRAGHLKEAYETNIPPAVS
jgi:hypothetical protein